MWGVLLFIIKAYVIMLGYKRTTNEDLRLKTRAAMMNDT